MIKTKMLTEVIHFCQEITVAVQRKTAVHADMAQWLDMALRMTMPDKKQQHHSKTYNKTTIPNIRYPV